MRGHVDGFEGCYVIGWAEGDAGTARIVIKSEDGATLGQGLAARDRGDLAALGLGRTTMGFRIAVTSPPDRQSVRVFADEVELPNSPIRTGTGHFDGWFNVLRDAADGWVTERFASPEPPIIEIIDQDGRIVGSATGEFDEIPVDTHFCPARFHIKLDNSCFNRGELHLSALANGVKFGSSSCDLRLLGHVEQVSTQRVAGWLFSPNAPGRAFTIAVTIGGREVALAPCRNNREDVTGHYPAAKRPGFEVRFDPPPHAPVEMEEISLRLTGSPTELFDGPYIVGPAAASVQLARKMAQLGFDPRLDLAPAERAVLQSAMAGLIADARAGRPFNGLRQKPAWPEPEGPRFSIIIPIYRGIEVTRRCIESVLAHRDSARDRIVLVNDHSPEDMMLPMLRTFLWHANLHLLDNTDNLGFIKSVNRGLSFCPAGDVILLNSDTRVFAGGLEELWHVAHDGTSIGTVTAMSNNATIFSYPHMSLRRERLDDIDWPELASLALQVNRGLALDVPTGHGFCMLITHAALSRIGGLDEIFGRGYGEENDFCAKAADVGFRNVIAPGALVEHTESISFLGDKTALLTANLATLDRRYPEYMSVIAAFERSDGLRSGRWALDAERLRRARAAGTEFALIVQHQLGGGTRKAIDDIEESVGYGAAEKLTLCCRPDGFVELAAKRPAMLAVFAPDEMEALFDVLSAGGVRLVMVHQVLGFPMAFAEELKDWVRERHGIFYAHDFYAFCPRVTMIDAVGRMCGGAPSDVCARCVKFGGAHESSQLTDMSPAEHRTLFADLLAAFRHVVTPSENAATYLRRMFPGQSIEVVPHPEAPAVPPERLREGNTDEIVLLGAIGPHKGSGMLLDVARRALLSHPTVHFRVIGCTDIDAQFTDLENVTVTGPYKPSELEGLCREATGRVALFLSAWPETYSYTLSEVVRLGFLPVAPDIGAPADRIRAGGFGILFPFPVTADGVLAAIARALDAPAPKLAAPKKFATKTNVVKLTRTLFGLDVRRSGRDEVTLSEAAK